MADFAMFFLQFSHNCHSLRYTVKESCRYNIITDDSAVCLHSHPLHRSYHYIEEVEHSPEEQEHNVCYQDQE